jgi:hypothetical protein
VIAADIDRCPDGISPRLVLPRLHLLCSVSFRFEVLSSLRRLHCLFLLTSCLVLSRLHLQSFQFEMISSRLVSSLRHLHCLVSFASASLISFRFGLSSRLVSSPLASSRLFAACTATVSTMPQCSLLLYLSLAVAVVFTIISLALRRRRRCIGLFFVYRHLQGDHLHLDLIDLVEQRGFHGCCCISLFLLLLLLLLLPPIYKITLRASTKIKVKTKSSTLHVRYCCISLPVALAAVFTIMSLALR